MSESSILERRIEMLERENTRLREALERVANEEAQAFVKDYDVPASPGVLYPKVETLNYGHAERYQEFAARLQSIARSALSTEEER